jgi:hypothetical protein
MSQRNFFAELKRRNVYKVAVAYAVVGWLIAQIATQIFPFLEIPNWIVRLVIVLIAIGFPIALVIAWAFEATPEGIKRTEDLPPDVAAKLPTWSPRKFATFIAAVAVIAAGLVAYPFLRTKPTPRQSEAVTGEAGRPATAGQLRPTSPPASEKSIAVLPFENLSAELAPDGLKRAEDVDSASAARQSRRHTWIQNL